jgi:hypothetical protein
MTNIGKQLSIAILAFAAAALPDAAHATTFTNTGSNSGTIFDFGAPDTTSYGEVFVAPGGALQNLSFFATDGTAGNLELVVAAWDTASHRGGPLHELSVSRRGRNV